MGKLAVFQTLVFFLVVVGGDVALAIDKCTLLNSLGINLSLCGCLTEMRCG